VPIVRGLSLQSHSLEPLRHWIFDMDGTLTRAIHDFDQIREQLGLPDNKPILESIATLDDTTAKRIHKQLHALEMDIAAEATSQPGAEELLRELQDQGCLIGILTRNGKDIAVETLRSCGLLEFFPENVIISRDCCAAKPAPDGVLMLMDHWQASPEHTGMVGDFLFDLEAGAAAGTATIHLDVNAQFAWPELTSLAISSLGQLSVALSPD